MDNKFQSKSQMKIFLMGGTKDSINIIKFLKEGNDLFDIPPYILTTTTTDYGGKLAEDAGSDKVIAKPLSKDEMVVILKNNQNNIGDISNMGDINSINNDSNEEMVDSSFDILIDATHPFAVNATITAIGATKIANVKYIRFERPAFDYSEYGNIHPTDSFKKAGEILSYNFKEKNILHLAGVNTIEEVLTSYQIPLKNFFVRVLPVISSIEKCNSLGIFGENIIAMQGVFSKNFNKTLMKEIDAQVIITKESGDTGGISSKIDAANELGIDVILVNRPKIDDLKKDFIVNTLSQLKLILNS